MLLAISGGGLAGGVGIEGAEGLVLSGAVFDFLLVDAVGGLVSGLASVRGSLLGTASGSS